MVQQTTLLLRAIWENLLWRDDLLATFNHWVKDGASRNEVRARLRAVVEAGLAKQEALLSHKIDLEQVHWGQITEFLCLCFFFQRTRRPLPTIPSDSLWEELSDQENWGPLSSHPDQEKAIQETVSVPMVPLERKLLTLGGRRLVYRYEPELENLLKRGEVFEGSVEFIEGEPCECHANAARYWNKEKEALVIVTGYALSNGLWRQHSWLVRKPFIVGQYRIIETTVEREKYFGYLLTDHEAEIFTKLNG